MEEEKERRKAIKLENLKEKEKRKEERINKLCWKNKGYIMLTILEILIWPGVLFCMLSPIWFPNAPLGFVLEMDFTIEAFLYFTIGVSFEIIIGIFLTNCIEYKKEMIRNNIRLTNE